MRKYFLMGFYKSLFSCAICDSKDFPIEDLNGKEKLCDKPGCPFVFNGGILSYKSDRSSHEKWQEEIYDGYGDVYESTCLPSQEGIPELLITYREHVRMLDRLGIVKGANVLDIGCSSGRMLNLMAARYKIQGIGIDISISALKSAISKNPYKHQFLQVNTSSGLPFKENCMDHIVCFDVVEHIERPDELIGEMHRVLKPNGRILLHIPVSDYGGTMDWFYKKLKPKKWEEATKATGHDYDNVIRTRREYEKIVSHAGMNIIYSQRYNSFLQNIFDYQITHRILNRIFYGKKVPFSVYHRYLAPTIEILLSPDRILQKMDIGASVYILAEKRPA